MEGAGMAEAGVAGVLVGALLAWILARTRSAATLEAEIAKATGQGRVEIAAHEARAAVTREELDRERAAHVATRQAMQALREGLDRVSDERAALAERASRVEGLETEVRRLGALVSDLREAHGLARAQLKSEQEQAKEKLALLTAARAQLSDQFKALADEILDAKSRKFTEQNREHLGRLLDPLATQISEFKKKVEDVYVQEGKDRTELASQVRQLMDLNRTLTREAHNLTTALKGQVKTQGNWGELLLERLLQHAGLERNTHYDVQESRARADGSRIQPDFVLKLPDDRRMVIDAKVTLVAYERYVNAETDAERDAALKDHLAAVRTHIRGLSEKNYQREYGLQSVDFVVMFMPVEPAFTLATSNDQSLFEDAYGRNILLVTNSTLLFVVRTVAYLWTTEKQNRNALDIASRGAELLEKLRLFAEEFVDMGSKLEAAHTHYDRALGRLSRGRGNLMRQAELLMELGVKAGSRPMPKVLLDARDAEEEREAAAATGANPAPGSAALPAPDGPPRNPPVEDRHARPEA